MKKLLIILLASISLVTAHSALWEKTQLMHAAAAGNIQEMQRLIALDADVNATAFCDFPHAGNPVLRYAIDSHSLEAVGILLEAGARVDDITESPLIYDTESNTANVRNLSLLSHAIRTKAPIDIIELLLQHGASIDGSPKIAGDWSALMIAAYTGYTQAVQVLIAAGADKAAINQMDNKTALDYAQEQNHPEIIKLLK